MKKNIARVAATVVLLLALFNVIAFAIPFVRTPVFWLAYAFTSAAIVAQLPLSLYAFTPKGGARDSLYGFPIAHLALVYLLVQAVVGLLCMALSAWIPLWAALVVEAVIFVLAAIGCMAASAIRDEIRRQDDSLKKRRRRHARIAVPRRGAGRTGAGRGRARGACEARR